MPYTSNMDKLILIDGNSLINRAYFALPPMNSPSGLPTQAVFGFVKMLIALIEKYLPTHFAVAFDLSTPTFRHAKYSAYKATRKGMPDDLAAQMPIIKQLLQDMQIKILEKEGYEADDILGTVGNMFDDTHTYIVTGDGDSLQLISDTVTVLITKKGISELEELTEQTLLQTKGLSPMQIVDYKALRGDSSDNIPGVKGIGEKTATMLLNKYHNLDGVYSNIDQITGTYKTKLLENKDMAYLSYELATIDTKVPIKLQKDECKLQFPFADNVRQSFANLGFNSFLNNKKLFDINMQDINTIIKEQKKCKISYVLDTKNLKQAIDKLQTNTIGIFFGDTVNFCDGQVEYVIRLKTDLLSDGMSLESVVEIIKPLLQDINTTKVSFDIKQTLRLLKEYGTTINNYFDVKLAEYILDFDNSQRELSSYLEYYNYNAGNYAFCFLDRMSVQIAALKDNNQSSLYFDIELPLIQVLFDMECEGMRIDTNFLYKLGVEYQAQLTKLGKEIQEIAGVEFNVNSPKQLAKVLFEDMKLEYPDKKSKSRSTAVDILSAVNDESGIIQKILQYRTVAKLNGTYVDGLLRLEKNGIVHSDFKQMQTITGRLSSIEPNLQNIPIRTQEGKKIRRAFVAREGKSLVAADYSQIELRLMAHFSQDPSMIQAFTKGEDIHTATASEVFDVPKDKVTTDMRRAAKAVNFGIIYGISDFGLAQDLGIYPKDARVYINKYFEKYPKIKEYMDNCVLIAKREGKISTIFNRIRVIKELKSPNRAIRQFGERAAMNMPMQGSASDIIKIAMNRVYQSIKDTSAKIILQVHDELILECNDNETQKISLILKDCMENATTLKVPLLVEIETGKVWE